MSASAFLSARFVSTRAFIGLLGAVTFSGLAHGQADTWKGGNGNWSNASMWSAGVPGSGSNVQIDNGNPAASSVTLDISDTINTLTIDSDDSLSFNNGTSLTVSGGSISNAGKITINGGNAVNSYLIFGANTTLSGGGTLTLSSAGGTAIIEGNGFTVANTNNTIQGWGTIGSGSLALSNAGTVDANQSAVTLLLNGTGGITNTNLLEATAGGVLQIDNTVNNTTGNITANGGTVDLVGADIQGGTLNSLNGGTLETPIGDSAKLDGSTHGALTLSAGSTYTGQFGSTTNVLGTINNSGNFQFNGGNASNAVLNLDANTTLQGKGAVTLSSSGGTAIIQGNFTLTNTNNTIQGYGTIGNGSLALSNAGTVNANQSAVTLLLNGTGGITNTNLLEATAGGVLQIQNTVNNAGGNITANGGTVNLVGADIQGGTLNNKNGGTFEAPVGDSATLDGSTHGALTLSAGSTYTGQFGSTTNVLGTINNNGNFQFNGGNASNAVLNLTANTTLQGGGKGSVTLSSSGGTAIIQGSGFTLTNTNNTIQGYGTIGNGSLSLVNGPAGTIYANQPGVALLINGSGKITNNGTFKVASGTTLHVTSGTFTNFSGTTLTGGTYNTAGTLEIDELGTTGGEIVTNASNIILSGASSAFIDANGNNALSAFNTNAATGSFTINSGRNFTTAGNFTNNGILTVGSSNSKFDVNGNLTNFSGTTLTGGTYNLTGVLQFNGANIVTNAANVTLTGTSSQIIDQTGANGLANFATNASGGSFTINSGRNFTTSGNFTNNGILNVGSSNSKFDVNGSLTNFSGTTLTGGTYNLTGTLEFNGANIVTNAANITLTGASSQIVNQTAGNGLANFATNASGGSFAINSGRNFTTSGNFTNAGLLNISSGTNFTVGGAGVFTQTGGTTTDDGTITDSGGLTLSGGSLFGKGTISGAVSDSAGTINPGDSSTLTGILTDKGAYTQGASGVLDISISGVTAGTQFDQLNVTSTANLNGTLNVSLIKGFVPKIGQAFKIMNFTSETGQFLHCTCAINSSEHFQITYQGTDVLLTVVAGGGGNFAGITPQATELSAYGGASLRALAGARIGFWSPQRLSAGLEIMPFRTGFITPANRSSHTGTEISALSPTSFRAAISRNIAPHSNLLLASGGTAFKQFSPLPSPRPFSNDGLSLTRNYFHAFSHTAQLQAVLAPEQFHGPATRSAFASVRLNRPMARTGATPQSRSGASGFRGRTVAGGLSWGLSNLLAKPHLGFAVQ